MNDKAEMAVSQLGVGSEPGVNLTVIAMTRSDAAYIKDALEFYIDEKDSKDQATETVKRCKKLFNLLPNRKMP